MKKFSNINIILKRAHHSFIFLILIIMIKYFSLFSWIWSVEYTIKKLWLWRENIWYSEIDKHVLKVYKHHYPENKNYWNIKNIDYSKIWKINVLFWTPPCQSFSIAWKEKWFQDERWKLIFNYFEFIRNTKPEFIFFENVPWLMINNNWKTFEFIKNEFEKLWYNIKYKKLNSKHFWSAQSRNRLFIIGQLKKYWEITYKFPTWEKNNIKIKDIIEPNVDKKYYLNNYQIKNRYKSTYNSNKSQFLNNTCCTITTTWKKRIITNKNDEFIKKYYHKKLENDELNDIEWRYFTENEWEMLQWFEKNYTNIWISETQRLKMLWNTVNIDVLSKILSNFDKYIKEKKK